jgi:hypothetical protein
MWSVKGVGHGVMRVVGVGMVGVGQGAGMVGVGQGAGMVAVGEQLALCKSCPEDGAEVREREHDAMRPWRMCMMSGGTT